MKITAMSFNTQHCMNYITREIDFDIFAETIRQSGADIIGMNEMRDAGVNPEYQAQAKILAEKLGFHYYFAKAIDFEGQNPYGNALLSRYPIPEAQTIPVPDPETRSYDGYYETRCLLKAKLDVPGGLTVCVIHFGLNPDEQQNALQTVLSSIEPERCLLMGDFNITPDNPIIATIGEKMVDMATLFTEPQLSFPSDEPRIKIDYVFASHDLKPVSAEILPIVVSDHCPHAAVLEV